MTQCRSSFCPPVCLNPCPYSSCLQLTVSAWLTDPRFRCLHQTLAGSKDNPFDWGRNAGSR